MGTQSSFAATQAAWRFYANEKTTLSTLAEPLIKATGDGITEHCEHYALVVHDWSSLNYKGHASKLDQRVLHNRYEKGYELQSSIVLSDRNGLPLGVVAQNISTTHGVWSSYQGDSLQVEKTHLEELAERVKAIENQGFSKPRVHIVDREGDAVAWLRAIGESHWLVRCRQNSTVCYQGKSVQVRVLAEELVYSTQFRAVQYKGKKAYQSVASVDVELVRAAKPKRRQNGKAQVINGRPLQARFVVSRIENAQGECLSQWYLLSNVFAVEAETIATWYFWRWQIECFFKLLKQQGLQVEDWQQESGLAIAKRLLVASQACIWVWQLQSQESVESHEMQKFLVRLSGRQMKRNRPITASALLEGLWLFLTMMDTLEHYSLSQLAEFRNTAFSFWESSDRKSVV